MTHRHSIIKTLRPLLLLVVAALCAVACRRDAADDILSRIPVDSPCVIFSADLADLAAEADIEITDTGLVMPDYMSGQTDNETLTFFAALRNAIDIRHVTGYIQGGISGSGMSKNFIAAEITDRDELDRALADYGMTASQEGNFTVYRYDADKSRRCSSRAVYIDGPAVWLTAMTADELTALFDKAAKNPLSAQDYIADRLMAPGAPLKIYCMLAPSKGSDASDSKWYLSDIRFEGSSLLCEATEMHADGTRCEAVYKPGKIGAEILGYVPQGINILAACGGPSRPVDIDSLREELTVFPPEYRTYLSLLAPYIKALDGPMLFALGYDGSDLSAIAMVSMEHEQVSRAISSLRALAGQYGLNVRAESADGFEVDASQLGVGGKGSLYVADVAGALTVATFPPHVQAEPSAVAMSLKDDQSGTVLICDSLGRYSDRFPDDAGIEIRSRGEISDDSNTVVTFRITVSGAGPKFIPALISLLSGYDRQ